ncbi:tRNA lysidine(34) synthetase TilS [Agrobacterium vitis]|uniref:tRNA(Ile)-lysidine synthase n=1 Tax=Agrobacterium vitis TaxID=373 RepID=A0A368NRF4_AGRVI|nr:tRNA lysidine(34) synthetase TilS [Agrobacterium vitis]KAA3517554.1 tRNA lysidine(34) synthetase TilS [Agrobacterium vitis]KAA3526955.1 tRNA lysidine(34) synthetase TilS [Agrobacterium vitis]MCF1477023.1 tRNA lysidine(34) synthetase TilS [Agrobacterium vitis]MUZ95793.1 tRNA lysidine(34) synthetase TilS [Agrobacterium vitis]MVA30651.1 tRNA lysidine(34) synthetase TilS [Agrobacterium vitis]
MLTASASETQLPGDDLPGESMPAPVSALSPEAAIAAFLDRINHPLRLLVAISGGSDSTGLLLALHVQLQAMPAKPVTLHAATIDHGLRDGSAAEAETVAALCARLGIPHVIRRWAGDKPKTGISAAARSARYQLLAGIAKEIGAAAILTGHTADDQIETIAMREKRSRNPAATGLAGMACSVLFENSIWITRPLLRARRQAIRAFLQAKGLGWVDDPSNDNPAYERARIRARLSASPQIGIPQNQRLFLSQQAATLLSTHATMVLPGLVNLDNALFEAPRAILFHALQALIATVGGQPHGPGQDALVRLIALCEQPPGARLTLGRCLAHRHRNGIYLVREGRNLPHDRVKPGETVLWDGRWHISNIGRAESPVQPGGTETDQTFPTLPASPLPVPLAALARQSLPGIGPNLLAVPVIAPYQGFLPGFDWPLAVALAGLFDAPGFLSPCF